MSQYRELMRYARERGFSRREAHAAARAAGIRLPNPGTRGQERGAAYLIVGGLAYLGVLALYNTAQADKQPSPPPPEEPKRYLAGIY